MLGVADRQFSLGSFCIALGFISLFYGDVWIGITIPLSVIVFSISPFFSKRRILARKINLAPGLLILSSVFFVVFLQKLIGIGPTTRSDYILYLPLFYALLCIFVTSNVPIEDRLLGQSVFAGTILLAGIMLFAVWFLPQGSQFLLSQHIPTANEVFREGAASKTVETSRVSERDKSCDPSSAISTCLEETLAPSDSKLSEAYQIDDLSRKIYDWKSKLRTPLGFSNYIALFFVFCVCVSLFSRNFSMASFATVATIVTVSRNGYVFLAVAYGLWGIRMWRGWSPIYANIVALGAIFLPMVIFSIAPIISSYPQAGSILVRVVHWEGALQALKSVWITGGARSYIMQIIDVGVYWNPHNTILWVAVIFGVLGLLIYSLYYVVVMKAIYIQAKSSCLWQGVYVGVAIMMAWGMLDVIALAPSYEMLVGALYGVAYMRSQQRQTVL